MRYLLALFVNRLVSVIWFNVVYLKEQ